MLKYKLQPCKECKDDEPKPTIKGLCQYHYRLERAKVYRERKKSPTKAKKPTGELVLFHEIYDAGPPVCFVTGQKLHSKEFYLRTKTFHHLFHHVLTKAAYPAFRLYGKNIIMVKPDVHALLETKAFSDLVKMNPGFQKVIDLKETLKTEYYERTNQRGF